jgi:hypothetical protein
LGDEIRPEYRTNWRATFYKSSWSTTIDPTWRKAAFTALNTEALTDPKWATNPFVTDPAKKKQVFVVRDRLGLHPLVPYLDLATPGNLGNTHIDHVEEVAAHFMQDGRKWKQPPRRIWYEDQTNLQLLNEHENLAKGGPDVTDWHVDITFRGPGEP